MKESQNADESGALLGCRDVEGAGHRLGLVGHHPDRAALDSAQGGDQLGRPAGPQLEQLPVVGDGRDGPAHVVGAGSAGREQVAQLGGRPVGRVGRRAGRRLLVGVVRQVVERGWPTTSRAGSGSSARRAATPVVRAWIRWPPSSLGGRLQPGELGHRGRPGDVGDRVRRHDDEVGHAEQQGRSGHRQAVGRRSRRGPPRSTPQRALAARPQPSREATPSTTSAPDDASTTTSGSRWARACGPRPRSSRCPCWRGIPGAGCDRP